MDKSKLVITIERQYGSGGRIVGKNWQRNWVFLFTMMKS